METHFEIIERTLKAEAGSKLLNNLKTLAQDAEALIQATAEEASEQTQQARARLVAALERAKATTVEFERKAALGAKAADRVIRANPYHSAGVAFGLGLLIGVLATRK